MNTMEVLLVECIDPSLPTMGGTDVYTKNLLEYLLKAGSVVTLPGVLRTGSFYADDRFRFAPIARKARLTGYEYFLRLMARIPFMRIPVSTIIHTQRVEYMLPFILFHRKNPRMVTLHGRILEGMKLKRRRIVRLIYGIVESFALKRSDIIIAVDETTRKYYQQQYPWLVKTRVIPIGIDLGKFRLLDRSGLRRKYGFKPDDKVVAYVGRLEKEKNLDFLLDCFKLLEASVHQAILVIVGDGRDREYLEGLASSLGLKRIMFMGAQEPDKIPEILNCADVLALCSIFEGSPTVVKEALACGVPVVSTNVGDVSQIIRGEATGRIVSKNKEDFAHALADVLLNEDGEKVRAECAKVAAEFGFDQVGAKTVELYQELVTRGLE